MFLHSLSYLAFLAAVVLISWRLKTPRRRSAFLLLASYVFYACFSVRFVLLLLGLTFATYYLARFGGERSRRRLLAWISVGISLGTLGVFKYADFFTQTVRAGIGLPASPGLQVLLPIGISFYTFQAISYSVDVYQGRMAPAVRLQDFALYLAFFPKLIAGPLVRPGLFLQQLENPTAPLSRERVMRGGGLLLLGLVRKVLIADSLAGLAQTAFRAAGMTSVAIPFPAPLYWQGFYLYAFQIYADFAGYTDIARGSAILLGFDLPANFMQPYFSTSVGAFWNRWHMTLTQWFRDYLFNPLSRKGLTAFGKRGARPVQVAVTLLTMTLVGLWHGASWTYAAWGCWHGILLSMERVLGWRPTSGGQRILGAVITFHLVGIGWVLFGAASLGTAGRFLAGVASLEGLRWLSLYLSPVILGGILVFGIDVVASRPGAAQSAKWRRWLPVFATSALIVLLSLAALALIRGESARPFIYGRF